KQIAATGSNVVVNMSFEDDADCGLHNLHGLSEPADCNRQQAQEWLDKYLRGVNLTRVLFLVAAGNDYGMHAAAASNEVALAGLTTGLAVEDRGWQFSGPTGLVTPLCTLSSESNIGGDISAVGFNIQAYTSAVGAPVQSVTGTSFATP